MDWRVLLVTAAGCGRLAFDTVRDGDAVCTPAGHDEDGDGIDDACDVCPHVVDDQRDSDGDGVGDACDPEPAIARQSIALFDPLTAPSDKWMLDNATIDATGLHMPGTTSYSNAQLALGTTSDLMIVGAHVTASSASSYHLQVSSGQDTTRYFYCERYASASKEIAQLTYTLDGTSYLHDGNDPFGSALLGGSGTISLSIDGDQVGCAIEWRGEHRGVTGTRHAILSDYVGVSANDCDAVIDYALLIHTNR